MADPVRYVGGTYRFEGVVYKNLGDPLPMDLAGATVYLKLYRPGGTVLTRNASIASPASSGVVYYETTASDLDVKGEWRRCFLVTQGTLSIPTDPVPFTVKEAP